MSNITIEGIIHEVKSLSIRDILRYYGCTDNKDTENMGCANHKSENHTSLWVRDDNTCMCASEGCGLSGDTIAVIAIFENWDLSKDFISKILPKAYEIVGREMPELDFNKEDRERFDRFSIIKKANAIFYIHSKKLLKTKAYEKVREYIKKKRDITDEQLDSLELGYFPKNSFDELKKKILSQIPTINDVYYEDKTKVKKYLLNSYYAMSNRIIHPHFYKGDIFYLTGEASPFTDDKGIKYKKLNSNFSVSGNAEGYLLDSLSSKDKSHLIISEGYWDALALKLLGFNTITFGTCKVSNYFINTYSDVLIKFNKVITCFDVEDNESGMAGAMSLNNKLMEKSIFNTFISKLKNKDGGKVDIEGLLHSFKTLEEKKSAINTFIIEDNKPYHEYFIEEIKNNNDADKLKDFLYYLEESKNIIFIRTISKKIMKELGLLSKDVKGAVKEKEVELKQVDKTVYEGEPGKDNYSDYELRKSELGFLLLQEGVNEDGDTIEKEKADFDIIQHQNRHSFDITKNKFKESKAFFFKLDTKAFLADDQIGIKNVLGSAKRDGVRLNRRDEESLVFHCKKFKPVEIKTTNCYGFVGDKYVDYPEFQLHNIVGKMDGGDIKLKEELASPKDNYKDFIEFEPNIKVLEKLKDMLNNKYPRSPTEKMYHKLIFAWSISSTLKMVLKNNGSKIHPLLIVLGEKRKGKTTAMEMFISKLWNNDSLTVSTFDGSKGSRLKHLESSLFPLYCDELMNLDKYSNDLKSSTTQGFLKIPRGTKDGGFLDIIKYFNLAISANKYSVNDMALQNRMIIFNYTDYKKSILGEMEISWMLDNMIHLGRDIYSKFKDFDFDTIIRDLDKKLISEGVIESRDRFKIIYIRLGECILEKLGLYENIEIKEGFILSHEESISISIKDTLREILLHIITHLPLKYNNGHITSSVSVGRIMVDEDNRNEIFTDEVFDELAKRGIYFTKGFKHILIGKNIIPLMNKELERKKLEFTKYKFIGGLADDLEVEYKNSPYPIEKPNKITSVKGIPIFELIDIVDSVDEEEPEEDTKEMFEKLIDD